MYRCINICEFNFRLENAPVAVLIQEKLQGADILTYLSTKEQYSEQTVAIIVTQVFLILHSLLKLLLTCLLNVILYTLYLPRYINYSCYFICIPIYSTK